MGPPETFDRTQAPKELWLDTGVELIANQESQAFEDYKRTGGRYSSLGPCPGSKSAGAFPSAKATPSPSARVATAKRNGCDDSRNPQKKAIYVTEPSSTPDSEEMPDLE